MRVAICDGDNLERKKYLDIFCSLAKKYKINAEFVLYSRSEEMLFCIEDKEFMDVLFIDIQMPGISGVEAAKKLRQLGYKGEIIFLTNLTDKQYILSGYDVGALHYIIKEKTPSEKIEEIFTLAQKSVEFKEKKYILFASVNEWANIAVESIRYFEMYKKVVSVYYDDEKFEFYSNNFESIKDQLAGFDFIRIHRSYYVALKEIKSLSYHTLVTRNGQNLPVGRTYYYQIKEALANYKNIHAIVKR